MPLIWGLEPRFAPRKDKCFHPHLTVLHHSSHSPCWGDWGIEQVAELARVQAGTDMLFSDKKKGFENTFREGQAIWTKVIFIGINYF